MTGKESETRRLLVAASHALKSYQFGNASPDLAEEIAQAIDAHLEWSHRQTLDPGCAVHAINASNNGPARKGDEP